MSNHSKNSFDEMCKFAAGQGEWVALLQNRSLQEVVI